METEDLKFIINRLDNYIDNTNTKATLIIVLDTFIAGSITSNIGRIRTILEIGWVSKLLMGISLVFLVFSGLFAVLSVKPVFQSLTNVLFIFSKKEKTRQYPSNIFFIDIASMNDSEQ